MVTRGLPRRLLVGAALVLVILAFGVVPGGLPAPSGVATHAALGGTVSAADAAADWGGGMTTTAPASVVPQLQTARIGVVYSSSEIGIYLAEERGYFAEQGLTAEYTRFDSGAFAVAPLSTGELEAASGVVSAAQ